MPRSRPRGDLFRAWVSSVVAALAAVAAMLLLTRLGDVGISTVTRSW